MLISLFKQLFRGRGIKGAGATDNPAICREALLAGNYEAAAQCYRRVLARYPADSAAYNDLGVALQRLGQHEDALVCYETAVRLAPTNADAWYNAGLIHHTQCRLDQAETCYRNAIRANPLHSEAHREFSMLRLAKGEFSAEVWSSFRHRRNCAGFVPSISRCPAPLWNGEPLDGKTVLVYGEQGLGDEILFASCYPDLIARAGHCIIETEPRLEQLFRRSFPTATVIGRQRQADLSMVYPEVAYKVPCGDLPLYFRSCRDEFPHSAYLIADTSATDRWRHTLHGLGSGLKVGISWRGGTPRTFQAIRSIDLAKWTPIFRIRGVHFVNLQYGECSADIEFARRRLGVELHHWPEAINDYDQTAALVCALDLVITVTTSLAHLAGALGQRVWILANATPRWCYLASGKTTPWYSSARIFRQTRPGDWEGVIRDTAEAVIWEFPEKSTGNS